MFWVILGALLSIAAGAIVYVWIERLGRSGAGLAGLRATALTGLILVLVNPARTELVRGGPPTVLLDASLSMSTRGSHWQAAVDTALRLAGGPGRVLRFATDVTPFDTSPPTAGATQLAPALRAAAGRSGRIVVVSDGMIDDAAALPTVLRRGLEVVTIPRDTVPDAALVDVAVEVRAQRGDSITGTYLLSTIGSLPRAGRLEVSAGDRRLISTEVPLPASPGLARRSFQMPGNLPAGVHVLTFRLTVPGDSEPRNDRRVRVITISEQSHVVVLVNPPDWEGRFLVSTLADVASTTVRGFARARTDRWVDMRTLAPVTQADVRAAVRGASLVIARGDVEPELSGWRGPVWRWPAGTEAATQSMPGDWYVTGETPASPIGRLGSAEWDSVPPLADLVPVVLARGDWSVLSARLGRRGAERPVVAARDSAGVRSLVTAADGLWRWSMRGGAAREAYRALVAGGVDWLLGAEAIRRTAALTSTPVVPRGLPVSFSWTQTPIPDSLPIRLAGDSSFPAVLQFDATGTARLELPPGVYRWSAPGVPGALGMVVVEEYSDEFRHRPVTLSSGDPGESFSVVEQRPRNWWWVFLVIMVAFMGEWAWRLSKGLP